MSPSEQPTKLSRTLTRRLAGRCCYGACTADALDGSDYCAPHDAHEKGRDAAKKRRQRLARAKAGRCVTGCGRKVGKRRVKRKWIAMRECPTCARRRAKKQRDARKRDVPGDSRDVPGGGDRPARGGFRTEQRTVVNWRDKSKQREYTAQRFVGRPRRGAPSKSDRDEDLRSDIDDAIAILTRIRDEGIALVRSAAVTELGAIARTEAHRDLAFQYLRVRAFCEFGAESFARGIVAEVDAIRRECGG